MRAGQNPFARIPERAQMDARVISPDGVASGLVHCRRLSPNTFVRGEHHRMKIGPAPVTPEEFVSGVRSKFPTQTPTVMSRV